MSAFVKGFGKGKKFKSGRYVLHKGKLVPVEQVNAHALVRRKDNVNIRSVATGVVPEQADQFNRLYGHLGVKFDERTGDAYYRDRAAKLRVLKARGYHDRDEVRG